MAAEDLSHFIKTRQRELNLSTTELARRSGMVRQSIYRLLNAEVEQARLSTLINMAFALEVHPLDLINIFFYGWSFPSVRTKNKELPHAISHSTEMHDAIGFMGDITYPDHSIVTPEQEFEKIWAIRNIGQVAWENRRITCVDDDIEVTFNQKNDFSYGLKPLEEKEILLPRVLPNETIHVAITFKAPNVACTTITWWKMTDADGRLMFPDITGLYCLVKVVPL